MKRHDIVPARTVGEVWNEYFPNYPASKFLKDDVRTTPTTSGVGEDCCEALVAAKEFLHKLDGHMMVFTPILRGVAFHLSILVFG